VGSPFLGMNAKTLGHIRFAQVDRLYRLRWFKADQGFEPFYESIPPITPPPRRKGFHYPVLVCNTIPLRKRCERLGVGLMNDRFVSPETADQPPVYWIWCQDGTVNRGKSPEYCRWVFREGERGLTADEGVAFHAQYPHIASRRFIDLPGSVLATDPSKVACIGPWSRRDDGKAWLDVICARQKHIECGSASVYIEHRSDRSGS
jgi:hypothetical protein